MALLTIVDPPRKRAVASKRIALLALGFRPFYLLAAAFAAVAVPLWVLVLAGKLGTPMPGLWWHAHEMLFGFAAAVIVGFLFTAGRNWTGLETPTGVGLAALALLWLSGRVMLLASGGGAAAVIDVLFLPIAATALARVLWRARSRRNYFVVLMLGVLSVANAAFHLGRLGVLPVDPLAALHFALGVIVLLETTIAGRVVPSFTASAIPKVAQWQRGWLNRLAIGFTGAALLSWVFFNGAAWGAGLGLVAALLQLARSIGWNPWATRRVPLLWVLHLSHLWIPVGLLLLAAAQSGLLAQSAGVHALTIGATGGLIIGMTTRTALGHTGRMLVAGRIETFAYFLVHLAALVRVATVAIVPSGAMLGVHIAAAAWSAAFMLYLWRYLPFLMRPRADGQPG
jgi:uncharacterized protein involved in response to NO